MIIDFGRMDERAIMTIARQCHEANRIYCESIGDNSQRPWIDAPEWQKVSAISGVKNILAGATAEQSHENWMKDKTADGWSYGEVKDAEAKTHPAMLPYDQLPAEQRVKDHIFRSVALSFVEAFYTGPTAAAA